MQYEYKSNLLKLQPFSVSSKLLFVALLFVALGSIYFICIHRIRTPAFLHMRMDNFFKTQRIGLCKHFLFPLLPHFKVSRWGSGHSLFKKEVRLCVSPKPETTRQPLSCQNRTPSRLQLKFIKFSTSVSANTHAGPGKPTVPKDLVAIQKRWMKGCY